MPKVGEEADESPDGLGGGTLVLDGQHGEEVSTVIETGGIRSCCVAVWES